MEAINCMLGNAASCWGTIKTEIKKKKSVTKEVKELTAPPK